MRCAAAMVGQGGAPAPGAVVSWRTRDLGADDQGRWWVGGLAIWSGAPAPSRVTRAVSRGFHGFFMGFASDLSPVTPLQRATDVPPPVFNQILMRDQQDDSDGPPQKRIPTLLLWPHGGKNIYVEGSWDHWTSKKAVQKSGKDHTILLELPSGVYRYRFIVDGERRFLPDLPCETDNVGNIVNLLDVNDFVPESVESVSELMAPSSPDSSYGFQVPDDKEFSKEPPTLPAQLYLGVLNSRSSERECARPRHVVLNHLYIEKGWGTQPLVALGHTHRFRSKYVTTVLYKAIER